WISGQHFSRVYDLGFLAALPLVLSLPCMYCAYIPLSLLHGAKAGFTYTPFGLGIEQYLGVLPKAMWRALFFFFHLDDCRYHTRNAPLGPQQSDTMNAQRKFLVAC
ncbi:hypothetical protein J3E73DRAFT_271010, partial [Bipolaris maydis]